MSPTDENRLKEKILEENKRIHALENKLYLARHPEQTNCYQTRLLEKTIETVCHRLNRPQAHILELGCGTGYLYLPMLARGYHMTGVDLSQEMVQVLQQSIPDDQKARSRLFVMDAVEFIETDQSQYDAVMLSALLHHLFDLEAAVRSFCAKVKPGGLLLIFFEPLKQEIRAPLRYALHKGLAGLDEFFYRREMQIRGIPLFEDDYEYADYQRRFGGIEPNRLREIIQSEGMEVIELKQYCARRYGAAAWTANRLLHTENTFNLLARKTE